MSKKKKGRVAPEAQAPAVQVAEAPAPEPVEVASVEEVEPIPSVEPERLHRVTVFVTEIALDALQRAHAEGQPIAVTVHPPQPDAQREYRAAYRQRPEVKEKQKAYRKQRAARLREEAAAKQLA